MSQSTNFTHSADAVETEAGDWLARLDRQGLADSGLELDALASRDAAFGAWLAQGIEHRVAFLRLHAAWLRSRRLSVYRKTPQGDEGRASYLRAAALAAGIMAMFGLALGLMMRDGPDSPVHMASGEGGHVAPAHGEVFETLVGGRRLAPLADGSVIELNTDTRIVADVSPAERRVELERGEAYFEIAHDPDHPFVVIVGDERITVLGTKFSVRRKANGMDVVVTEGRVRIDRAEKEDSAQAVLVSGVVAKTDSGSVLVEQPAPDAIGRKLSWRTGRLDFDGARLGDIVEEFNRYNDIRLVVADSEVAEIRIGGSFKSDNVDAFLRLVTAGLGLQASQSDGQIFIAAEKTSSAP